MYGKTEVVRMTRAMRYPRRKHDLMLRFTPLRSDGCTVKQRQIASPEHRSTWGGYEPARGLEP